MNNARLVLIVMIIFTALTWYSVFNNKKQSQIEYAQCISDADALAEKGIYIDAVEQYNKALEMDPDNYDIMLKIFDSYKNLNDEKGLEEIYERAKNADPKNESIYIKFADYYMSLENYDDAADIVLEARENKAGGNINALYDELSVQYSEIYVDLSAFKTEYNGYVPVMSKKGWGMSSSNLKKKIKYKYDEIGAYSSEKEVIPVCDGGEWYYIDINGNRKLVPDNSYQYLGLISGGYAPALRDGSYGYVNEDFEEFNFDYDYAGAFESGIAPVKKDGKWAVIDDDLKQVTDFIYDDVIINEYGVCSYNGLYFASKDGKYNLYDKSGDMVGNEGFENADMFVSDLPAAVCRDGKWGYVSNEGEITIDFQYNGARSFSNGFAAVQKESGWGYISLDNKQGTEFAFNSAGYVMNSGKAIVTSDNDSCKAIEFVMLSKEAENK